MLENLTTQMMALRDTLPPPVSRGGCFCPELFLRAYPSAADELSHKQTRAVLDMISRKIEVGNVLCAAYPPGMRGASVDGVRVAPGYMIMACAAMLHAAHLYAEPAYLNCALKMLDGIAAPQTEYPDWLRTVASALASAPLPRWRP